MASTNMNQEIIKQDGYRLGGKNDGMFICQDCYEANRELYQIDRIHQPLEPITCLECNQRFISWLHTANSA